MYAHTQVVAVHNGQIIDSDPDGRTLSKCIRQQDEGNRYAPIQMADSPEPPTLYWGWPNLGLLLCASDG